MKIIKNSLKCLKCSSIIESKHVHDFQYCDCKSCFVDGGLEYLKRGGNPEDYQDLSIMEDNDMQNETRLKTVEINTQIPLDQFFETILDKMTTEQKEELLYMIENSLEDVDDEENATDYIESQQSNLSWDDVRK